MIEVITFSAAGTKIDTAEADTPEAALVAARTLLREATMVNGVPVQMAKPFVRFFVDGEMVREVQYV